MADNIIPLSDEDAAGINADLDQQEDDFDDLEDDDLDIRRMKSQSQGWAAVEYEAENLPSRVGPKATSLFWAARLRSSRLMEDGIIPWSARRDLAASAGLSLQGFRVAAVRLVEDGTWAALHDSNGELVGWKDVRFLAWNLKKTSRQSKKQKGRERSRKYDEKKREDKPVANTDD